MHYKITTLVENAVYGRGLQAEHGLSLLIETGKYKILFDTGHIIGKTKSTIFQNEKYKKGMSFKHHLCDT